MCSSSHLNDVCASWMFLSPEHERSVPTEDRASSLFPFVFHVHLVVAFFPLTCSLAERIVCHLCDRYVLAVSNEVIADLEYWVLSNLCYAHPHGYTNTQVGHHPTVTFLDWLVLLMLTPVPVCETPVRQRETAHTLGGTHWSHTLDSSWVDFSLLDINLKKVGTQAFRCFIRNMI